MTINELARQLDNSFIRDKRTDGTEFVKLKDGSPDWMRDLCIAAHDLDGMGPDDWRYAFVADATHAISEEQDGPVDLDTAYPYTHERLSWLSSHSYRPAYCGEAIEDRGEYPRIKDGNMMLTLVAWGMAREMNEVFHTVRSFLEKKAEEDSGNLLDNSE